MVIATFLLGGCLQGLAPSSAITSSASNVLPFLAGRLGPKAFVDLVALAVIASFATTGAFGEEGVVKRRARSFRSMVFSLTSVATFGLKPTPWGDIVAETIRGG